MVTEIFIDKANLVLQAAANHPYLAVLVYLAGMAISRVWHSARFAECWYQLTGGLLGRMLVDVASVFAWPMKLIIAYMALFWRMPPGPPPPEVDQPKDLATEDARLVKEVTDADTQLQQHSVENAALIEEITKLKERANLKEAQTEQHSAENARLTEEVASLQEKLRNYEKTVRVLPFTDNAPIATIEPAIPASGVVSIDENSARKDELNDNVHEEAQDEGETEKEENQVTKSDEKNEVEKEQEHEDENKTDGEDERDQDAKKDDDGDDDDKDDHHDLGGGGAILMLPDHSLSASSIPAPPEQPTTPDTNVLEQVHTPSTELPVPALPTLALKSPATHKRRLSDPEEPQRSGHGPASRPIPTESSILPSISSSATVASALVTAQLPTFGNEPGSSATIAPNAQVDDNEAMEVVETQPGDKTEGSEKDNGYLMDGVVGEPTVTVERVAETHDGSMDGVIQQAPPVAIVGINNVHGDAMEVIEVETNQDARNMMEGVTQFETTTREDQEMADDIRSTQGFNMHQYTDRDMHDNFSSITPAVEIVDTDMQNDPFFTYTPRQPATQVAIDREIEMDILEDLRPELPATPGEFGPIDEIFDETLVEAGPSSPPLILSALPSPPVAPVHEQNNQKQTPTGTESAEDIATHQQSVYTTRRELEQEVEASEIQETTGGEDGHRDRIVRVVERAEQNQSESVFTYGGHATREERLAVLRLLIDILRGQNQDTGAARKFRSWGGERRLKLLSKEMWQELPGAPEDQKTFLTREQVNDLLGRWMRYLLEGLVQQGIVYADEMEGILREWMRMVEEERRSQRQ
ncbi:hypothetical protein K4K52_011953 [Colletotrichum sp. SAR 10_76]|nr:hypothetical protein K4K52_011953 [Colletotrichum sp. SAR 10_76]